MKIKTSELTGAALDWAVAKADGWAPAPNYHDIPTLLRCGDRRYQHELRYSTDWSQGGPIIERERINVSPNFSDNEWHAWPQANPRAGERGPDALIAAMRCFVVSKLGDEVDVPEELLK